MKTVPLTVKAELSEASLELAAEQLKQSSPGVSVANLTVHPSDLRDATRLAAAWNRGKPEMPIFVTARETLARWTWKLAGKGVEITSEGI